MFRNVDSVSYVEDLYNPFLDSFAPAYENKVEKKYFAPGVKKVVNIYNKKAIISGNIVEIIYYQIPVFEGYENKSTGKKKTKSDTKKRTNNINQSKMKLRRLINSNITGKDLFITLTYADNMCDIDAGKDDFKKFIKRWNYQRKKKSLDALQYVYVVEFQKRGAVHFHCIFFNVGFILNSELNSLWGNGFVKVNKIDKVDNVGAYVVKYMQKDLIDSRLNGKDLYGRSKGNLSEPLEVKNPQEVAVLEDSLLNNCVYQNSYFTDYYGEMTYKQYNLKRDNIQEKEK